MALGAIIDQVHGQTIEEKEMYPEFDQAAAQWGYTWKSYKVTTDDGFILTTFRITGTTDGDTEPRDDSLMPVMIMNGLSCDAVNWFDYEPNEHKKNKSIPMMLYDDGFDVWLAANRGTKYCQNHVTLEVTQPEFWDWSWAEMGLQDDVSNIKMIKQETGKAKVSYIGSSQGTVQMFYALAKIEESFLKDNLFTFAALDPCTIDVSEGDQMYEDGLLQFLDYGIYAFNGPNWDKDLVTICETFDHEVCQYAWNSTGGEAVATKSNIHWAQNTILGKFQEYAPNYNDGEVESTPIDLSTIKHVPVTIWSGLLDRTCSHF
jgi:pimeloyl-ACP methyl ester carboxylesterase